MADFEQCYKKTLELEGGYLLHTVPGDRGGMTFAGVARNSWPDWAGWQLIDGGETSGPRIEAMVAEFYRSNFWGPIRGEQILYQNVAFAIYDFAVNAGLTTSVKIAQGIVGAMPDGHVGPKTIAALSKYIYDDVTSRLFVAEFGLAKIYRYKDICLDDPRRKQDQVKSNLQFLCGWVNRVQKGQKYA